MELEKLIDQRTSLVLQRSAAKDTVEACERQLGVVSFAIQALEEDQKAREEALAELNTVD